MCPVALIQDTHNYKQLDDGQEALRQSMTWLVDDQGACLMKKLIEPYLPDFSQLDLFSHRAKE